MVLTVVAVEQISEPFCVGSFLCFSVPSWPAVPAFQPLLLLPGPPRLLYCSPLDMEELCQTYRQRHLQMSLLCLLQRLGMSCQMIITRVEGCQGLVYVPKSQHDSKSSSCGILLAYLDVQLHHPLSSAVKIPTSYLSLIKKKKKKSPFSLWACPLDDNM